MSEAESVTGEQSAELIRIPSLLTNSFQGIVEEFGGQITMVKAMGSIETANRSTPDGFREYGLAREQRSTHRMTIDYEQLPGEDGIVNPLDGEAQEELFEEIEAVLDTDETSVKPDLAVTSLGIRVEAPEIREVTPAQSDEFDLYFVADRAEPPVKEATKRLNAGRGLYDELGFEVRNLNLRTVIETETKYHEQSDGRYFSWGGPEDIRPRAPERLAIRVNEHVLPDRFGALKPYYVTDDRVLQVPEDADEELAEQMMAGQGGQ